MTKIIPTIFALNKKEFNKRFRKLIELNTNLHIDFMDGKFVKSKGIKISDLPKLNKYKIGFEVHLMSLNPQKYINNLKLKGFNKIIFHFEVIDSNQISKLIDKIKAKRMEAWIAVNPNTNINKIIKFLPEINGVLFMGVYPGKEHQKFIKKVYAKLKKLRRINKKIKIQVDGGVNLNIAKNLRKIGVNYINSGSFIANAKNPKHALRELEKRFI